MDNVLRVAMWSGPRNISTAMMRSFENRSDCEVWDEPLYGPYLATTGKQHPGADEVIADQGSDWREVVEKILGPAPNGAPVFYQKHMTHHMLPHISLDWLDSLCNCFLIRHPAQVLASYSVRRSEFDASDLGFPQQLELFRYVCERSASIPPVLDSRDVLADPHGMISALCDCIGIEFQQQMLAWPAGRRDTDGVWSKYWYDKVWESTGFAPYTPNSIELNPIRQSMVDECMPAYEELYRHRIAPD